MSIILASASPRRAELLQKIGLDFTIDPSDIDESVYQEELVEDYVKRMAMTKSQVAQKRYTHQDVIISADTCVAIDQTILGKPENEADCQAMLAKLSGNTHWVHTAVVVSQGDYLAQALSSSRVTFREISPQEAKNYWQTGEPKDKAGSYAIQGLGAIFVSQIKGSYSGVVGLPLYELTQLLKKINITII